MMKMTNRELETRYTQMKLTWENLVNANFELVDENKMLKEEIERLNENNQAMQEEMARTWKKLDKLQKLKGSDKE